MSAKLYRPTAAVRALLAFYAQLVEDDELRGPDDLSLLWNAVKRAAEAESEMGHDEAVAWTIAQLGARPV